MGFAAAGWESAADDGEGADGAVGDGEFFSGGKKGCWYTRLKTMGFGANAGMCMCM